ncbi:hypothetical protein [Streptomyces sp. NBC_01217]|uniref:hypothetical protein n=1 Tax=Streptomyces sp. NBC_01217 TaxID=2903779 RepID=UPI002E113241|nr:hypothetical protein OG507_04425 [Streptomyces sp. NBC_01217]
MATIMKQPREVHLMEPVSPRPYPGCDVCGALVREWIDITEPASPAYDINNAYRIVDEINEHRKQDEESAPAL